MTVITVPLPDYQVRTEPDHRAIGRRVDAAIRASFFGRKIVGRGVSAHDHPGLTVDELIKIILNTGTDRYDPHRTGDRYENIANKRIDLFGLRRTVTPRMRLFDQLSWGFYHGSIEIRGRPTRRLPLRRPGTQVGGRARRAQARPGLKRFRSSLRTSCRGVATAAD